ncbi:phosphoribosyltransferase family protein [uncultured Arcticibacterium sp.]|uniref:phosphoribosyltransferase family protein n=1 Tax=uncultured Arcticibacterium sp. TaxID=2173042 RepID=UPI0030F6D25E
MEYQYYNQFINKETKGRYDVTPIFENPEVFAHLLKDLIKPFNTTSFDKIAGIDALGFVIGGALAQNKKVGFICIRKGGKLPGMASQVLKSSSFSDYTSTQKSLEINRASIKKGDKILLIDEWIETGTQMKAAVSLIETLGGEVIGISSLCSHRNEKTEVLFEKYNLKALEVIDER